jgi:hypothetical protein
LREGRRRSSLPLSENYQVIVTVKPVAPSLYEPADTSWPAKIRP